MATTSAKKAVKKTTPAPRRAAKKIEVAIADVKAEAVNAEAVPAEAPVSVKSAKVAKPKAATTSAKSTKSTKAAKPAKPATAASVETKAKRVKKEKVVRDSFTMPKSDYAKLASLKQKCLEGGVRVKKSELLRAALAMLDAAPAKNLIAAVGALETVKTGRPANA